MPQTTVPKAQAKNSLLQSDNLLQLLGVDAVQILKCGICLEFFDLPIVLPCGHTFCLHCLTEMCRHASRTNSHASLQDVRIGCPNCRILIYASPVLERNVTCNFSIQSLIELLRAREDRQTQDKRVNTDEVRIGPKIRTPSDNDLARLMQDLDRMTEALGKRNVVDLAYFEIDQIRRSHLAKEMDSKPLDNTNNRCSRPTKVQTPECGSNSSYHPNKPGATPPFINPRPALLNAIPFNPSPYLNTPSPLIAGTGNGNGNGNGCGAAIVKSVHPNKSLFSYSHHQPYCGGQQNMIPTPTSTPLPTQQRILSVPAQQLLLQNQNRQNQQQIHQSQSQQQQQKQQHAAPGLAEKTWPTAEHSHPAAKSNNCVAVGITSTTSSSSPSSNSKMMIQQAPLGLGPTGGAHHQTSMLPHQQAHPQMRKESLGFLSLSRSDSRAAPNKMAVCPTAVTKGSPDVGVSHGNRKLPSGQGGHEQQQQTTPVCSGRLDNDPAVMSYSCASTSMCHLTSHGHS